MNPKRASAVLRTQDHNHFEVMGARVFIARYAKLKVAEIKSLHRLQLGALIDCVEKDSGCSVGC
jgi:hypothetical protein